MHFIICDLNFMKYFYFYNSFSFFFFFFLWIYIALDGIYSTLQVLEMLRVYYQIFILLCLIIVELHSDK